ncbi:hypothetical protein [Candidatus Lucifugimonas marina]|uniref:hypothetical protein n=1 Tax=Candidatus Lucifugimonas marina TaxID=3038979 RepID=UPI00319E5813
MLGAEYVAVGARASAEELEQAEMTRTRVKPAISAFSTGQFFVMGEMCIFNSRLLGALGSYDDSLHTDAYLLCSYRKDACMQHSYNQQKSPRQRRGLFLIRLNGDPEQIRAADLNDSCLNTISSVRDSISSGVHLSTLFAERQSIGQSRSVITWYRRISPQYCSFFIVTTLSGKEL